MKKMLTLIFAISCLGLVNPSIGAEPSQRNFCEGNGINYSEATQFVSKIYTLIQNEDAEALSDYMTYPLTVNQDGHKPRLLKTREQFIDEYDELFTEATLRTFENSGQELFCNSQGASFGNGTLWFRTQGGSKIFVINVAASD
jgi:hypothetical protein